MTEKRAYAVWVLAKYPTSISALGCCSSATLAMVAAFPELKRVRGHVNGVGKPQEVACKRGNGPHLPDTHPDQNVMGTECIDPRPALPEEVVCDHFPRGKHRRNFLCINPRPAHPPSLVLGEKGDSNESK